MGRTAQLLLVSCLLALFMPPAIAEVSDKLQLSHKVYAHDYQAFWLWSGVNPQPALQQANQVYLHQGEVVIRQRAAWFQKMGLPSSRLTLPAMWVTVRITTLDVPDDILAILIDLPRRWAAAGNQVIGLQIDFDAGTYRLDDYAGFLRRVRTKLDPNFALGVTGLLDWAKTGSIQQLNALPIDELVIQTYQGRSTVNQYSRYLPALLQLRLPFKIGLVQHGEWDPQWEQYLAASPFYRGEVVFLLNHLRSEPANGK